jgi:outer membrane protein assembly factor BamC
MGKNMKTSNIVIGLIAVSLLAGCGIITDRKQVDYQAAAVQAPSLEVPPDMTLPVADPRYAIPAADGTQVAKYSEFSRNKVAAKPQAVAAPAAATAVAAPAAKLMEVAGIRFILLNEPFDRSWRKAGLALEHSGIAVSDVDRNKGVYFLKASSKEKKTDDIQVLVHEANGTTDVTVKEGADLHSKEATRILDALFKNLEK